jgi:hypothetical protein
VGNYVPTFCQRGPHGLFRACKREGCLIFCMCVVVVLIFVLSTLCCAPSRAFLYFVLLLAIFVVCICVPRLQVGFLPAFEHLLINLLQVALVWDFICLLVYAPPLCGHSFCVRGLVTHLFLILQIIRLYTGMFVC